MSRRPSKKELEERIGPLRKPKNNKPKNAPVAQSLELPGSPIVKSGRRKVVLSLGSNVGNREEQLLSAVEQVAKLPSTKLSGVGQLFETAPVGGPQQPDFLNTVIQVKTSLLPDELLDSIHDIESEHGRLRITRWGPRSLDIDIISVEGVIQSDPSLTIPHPRAAERAFVLIPWLDLDPTAVLPGSGPIANLIESCGDKNGVHPYQRTLAGWEDLVK